MVKCVECGFLAVRHLETQVLVGPGDNQRKTGAPPEGMELRANLDITPVCAIGACELQEDVVGPIAAYAAKAMQKERECSLFTPWIPVLSPKEHLDMTVLERQKEWQRKCQEEDQRWREDQADKQLIWQHQQHQTDLRFRSLHMIILVLVGFGAVWLAKTWSTPPPQQSAAVLAAPTSEPADAKIPSPIK